MPMLGAVLTPHPPVLLPEVGCGREKEIDATGRAMAAAAEDAIEFVRGKMRLLNPNKFSF